MKLAVEGRCTVVVNGEGQIKRLTCNEVRFIEGSKKATEGRQRGRQNLKRAVSKSIGFIASDGPDQFRRPGQFSFKHAI